MTHRVGIIGGGISGLAAAHRLHELHPDWQLLLYEASQRLGGALHSALAPDGTCYELGADSFVTNLPWALDLCRRLGLDAELLDTDAAHRRAFIVHQNRLVPVPEGFSLMAASRWWPLVTTPLLSWRGKLRLALERWVPRRAESADESLAAFATRRLGREAYERLVQPLVAGIYTADPHRLSMQAAMPRFFEFERQSGSITRGLLQEPARATDTAASGARYSLFVTPRRGLSSLAEAIAARLPQGTIRLGTPVARLEKRAGGYRALMAANDSPAPSAALDAVVVATPAPVAARLLADLHAELASALADIEYAGCSIVVLAFRREAIAHRLDGFGFVVPEIEGRQVLAGSFSSVKFPGRGPADQVLLRVFLGGACHPEIDALADDDLVRVALDELEPWLGIRGAPLWTRVARWRGAMPQYHLGHAERVARIEALAGQLPRLALAGNAYHGVGIPQCIRSGEQAAEEIARQLAAP